MTEINKCPVCGCVGAEVTPCGSGKYRNVVCNAAPDQLSDEACGMEGPAMVTEEEAIAAWNRLSYKAPVKKTVKVAWVRKNAEGGGKLSFAILLDTLDIEPYYRGLGYDIVDVKEVEFEIE